MTTLNELVVSMSDPEVRRIVARRIAERKVHQCFAPDASAPIEVRKLSFRHNGDGVSTELARLMRQSRS